jgi:ATP-dependent RNA helicase DDX35
MAGGLGFWKPKAGETASHDDVNGSVSSSSRRPNTSLAMQRRLLPIYQHRQQILYAIEHHGIVIVVGETGSGKSTQLPQYLIDGGWADHGFRLAVTQPRRVAAMTLAQRVAQETGTELGQDVGYLVRFDSKTSDNTRLVFCTDGILLRAASMEDPLLSQYSVVILDEAHERNLPTDALLGLLKKIRRKRPGLRIVVCSATIDAPAFLEFFLGKKQAEPPEPKRQRRWGPALDTTAAGKKADTEARHAVASRGTIISVDGRQHPVDVHYVVKPVSDYIRATVETAHSILYHRKGTQNNGDILCFLPSGEDIDQATRYATEQQFTFDQLANIDFLPLYGSLPHHLQMKIFKDKSLKRRIIFATNIAETSVTVPNVSYVIDSGLAKIPYFDPATGLERLIVCPISHASAVSHNLAVCRPMAALDDLSLLTLLGCTAPKNWPGRTSATRILLPIVYQ